METDMLGKLEQDQGAGGAIAGPVAGQKP